MENPILPPPFPGKPGSKMPYGKKCVLLGLQCLLLMIGTLIVWVLVYSRERLNEEVVNEIVAGWGGIVNFNGIVVVPDSATSSNSTVAPSFYTSEATVNTQSLHRGIYEAEVFNADIKTSGTFNTRQIRDYIGDKVRLYLDFPENRIVRLGKVKIGGQDYEWHLVNDTLTVSLNLAEMPENFDFETSFTTRGSEGLYVTEVGKSNRISINGNASNPSFQGSSLPVSRSMTHDESFKALWASRRVDTASPQSVGAEFLVGVDRYQKVSRSLKYSFIIILLTYIAVLTVEILRKRRMPLLNYFLIGVALIVFYTLLLSFVELVAFWLAYLIAAGMTVALISGYIGMSMKSRQTGLAIGLMMTVYYAACFIMLSSVYALLFGSLLLFVVLTLLMYATLRIRS